MHFITGKITLDIFHRLNLLVCTCRFLDMADSGQHPATPEGYQSVAKTARAVMHELVNLQLPHIREALEYFAGVNNAACELLEARRFEEQLVGSPQELEELAKVLENARDPSNRAACGTPVLSIVCRQGADRDHVHVTGVNLLDADSRGILETILRAVSEPDISPDSMSLSTLVGSGDALARMLHSTLSARSIAVRTVCAR